MGEQQSFEITINDKKQLACKEKPRKFKYSIQLTARTVELITFLAVKLKMGRK